MASDCLIVGAGLVGLLTARELAREGLSVTVLERGSVAREASWAGGGILSPMHPWEHPAPVTRLARWSQGVYPDLAAELAGRTGIDPEWTASGLLTLEPEAREAAVAWAAETGTTVEAVTAAEAGRLEPALDEPPHGALWMPGVAQIRNPRLARAARIDVESGGVSVREGVEVTGLVLDGDRVIGVRTAQGRVDAGHVLLAAGPWTPGLLGELQPTPAIRPVRGQMILFRAEPERLRRVVLRGARYLIPRRDGRVLCGSTVEEVGFDSATTAGARETLYRSAVDLVPALAGYPVEAHWAGLRPAAPAGIPYIGPHPTVRGLYINAGHHRNGVVMAPGAARLLADLLLGRAPILDPGPYALDAPRAE